ncbi:rna-directed dna polymerase from mobile element jockey-like [Willisornis vidua]|uniref:Rna-directed dna polymerase from mobile element jockey-like n=1 Tax=Willisornis vidua TaxID=1566151 RepID=A0ABQ9DTM5_9PASS|nr:rna-directed dna polymerase from mobile element jockey-like [Willisornis vidua]
MDKSDWHNIIYLYLCKAFDTNLHNILVSRLERHGFDGRTIQWIRHWQDQHLDVQVETSDNPSGFKIFVGDLDNGIEGILFKFADDTKLCGVVNTLEGRGGIQWDPDRLQRWTYVNTIKFSKAKRKVLHLDRENPKHKYRLGRK